MDGVRREIFCQNGATLLYDFGCYSSVGRRIDCAESVGHYSYCRKSGVQAGPMSRYVDAESESADDGDRRIGLFGNSADKLRGHVVAVDGRMARSYDSQAVDGIQIEVAESEENHGRVVTLEKQSGIVRIGEIEHPDGVRFDKRHLGASLFERFPAMAVGEYLGAGAHQGRDLSGRHREEHFFGATPLKKHTGHRQLYAAQPRKGKFIKPVGHRSSSLANAAPSSSPRLRRPLTIDTIVIRPLTASSPEGSL